MKSSVIALLAVSSAQEALGFLVPTAPSLLRSQSHGISKISLHDAHLGPATAAGLLPAKQRLTLRMSEEGEHGRTGIEKLASFFSGKRKFSHSEEDILKNFEGSAQSFDHSEEEKLEGWNNQPTTEDLAKAEEAYFQKVERQAPGLTQREEQYMNGVVSSRAPVELAKAEEEFFQTVEPKPAPPMDHGEENTLEFLSSTTTLFRTSGPFGNAEESTLSDRNRKK